MAGQLAASDPLLRGAAQRVVGSTRGRQSELARCAAIAEQLLEELSEHPKQLAACVDDSSQVAEICTRQAGKTKSAVHRMLRTGLTKTGAYSLYARTSKDECRNNIWDNTDDVGLLSTIERLKIPCDTHDTRMTVSFPATGSRIKLIGLDDEAEVRKLRGPTYDDVLLDEAQDVAYVKAFLAAVRAGLVKRRGSVRLMGTPGKVCEGEFFDITRTDGGPRTLGWSVHEFTIYDNPGIPHALEYVEKQVRENGWTDDNEEFRREFGGRERRPQWVTASGLLVYRLAGVPVAKRYHDLPVGERGRLVGPHDWRYVVGIDLGFYPDPFATVVWGYCDDLPCLFEVESASYESLNTEQQAGILAGLVDRFDPERMVADAGSGGLKQIVIGDWQQRFGLPVDAAQKEHKDSAIDMFNADVIAERIKVRQGSPLDRQMLVLPWKNQIGARRVEDVRRNKGKFHNDLCDAGLYGYRETSFFEGRPRDAGPPPGTPEHDELVMDDRRGRVIERYAEEGEPSSLYDLGDERGDWRRWG